MMQLTNTQISELVTLLLNCDSIKDRQIRNDVLAFLQDNVRSAIARRDQDRADVVNIIRTCNTYPGAFDDLVDGVRCFDGGSTPLRDLEHFWQGLARSNLQTQPAVNRSFLSYQKIEETLCNTDFRQAFDIFQQVMQSFGSSGGAALFLLQNSYPMGAQWLIKRIGSRLREIVYPVHTVYIGFESGMLHDEYGVLQRLAEWFPPQPTLGQIEHYAQEIIRRICTSVANRKVIFIELSTWDRLQPQERMLAWFVQEFWTQLVDELDRLIAEQDLRRVYVIAVMVAETEIPGDALTPHLCYAEAFASNRILSLPLENWTLDDIQGWLEAYSHLRSGRMIDEEARRIFEMSVSGTPRLVANILLEQFAHTQEQ
jgi:hypothetical protein